MQLNWVKLGVVTAKQEGGVKSQNVDLYVAQCGEELVFSVRFLEKGNYPFEYLIGDDAGNKFYVHAGGKFVIPNLYFRNTKFN